MVNLIMFLSGICSFDYVLVFLFYFCKIWILFGKYESYSFVIISLYIVKLRSILSRFIRKK